MVLDPSLYVLYILLEALFKYGLVLLGLIIVFLSEFRLRCTERRGLIALSPECHLKGGANL
jgi:hypothetical protein